MKPTTISHSDLRDDPFAFVVRAAGRGIIRTTCERCLDRVHPEALVLTDAGVMCEDCAEEVARDD